MTSDLHFNYLLFFFFYRLKSEKEKMESQLKKEIKVIKNQLNDNRQR